MHRYLILVFALLLSACSTTGNIKSQQLSSPNFAAGNISKTPGSAKFQANADKWKCKHIKQHNQSLNTKMLSADNSIKTGFSNKTLIKNDAGAVFVCEIKNMMQNNMRAVIKIKNHART